VSCVCQRGGSWVYIRHNTQLKWRPVLAPTYKAPLHAQPWHHWRRIRMLALGIPWQQNEKGMPHEMLCRAQGDSMWSGAGHILIQWHRHGLLTYQERTALHACPTLCLCWSGHHSATHGSGRLDTCAHPETACIHRNKSIWVACPSLCRHAFLSQIAIPFARFVAFYPRLKLSSQLSPRVQMSTI